MDARAWDKIRKKKKTVLPRYHHVVCIEKNKTFKPKTSIAESASISV